MVSTLEDFNKQKKLDVDSVSGTPTVDKATPIVISGGDDSTTGNGDIVIDFSNISDPQDIAVYDQNDNLLDYEIEDLDTTNNTAVLWCYNSWVRDGTTQAKIAYGNNSDNTDNQNVTGTWGNTGQNAQLVYHLNETSGQTIDSTSNNNDSTNTIGTQFNVSGEFDGGRGLDGLDDIINYPDAVISKNTPWTFSVIVDYDGPTGANNYILHWVDHNDVVFDFDGLNSNNMTLNFGNGGEVTSGIDPQAGETYHIVGTFDGSTAKLFVDGVEKGSSSETYLSRDESGGNAIGGDTGGGAHFDGTLDEFKIFSESWSTENVKAEYDASPKGGQVFFSQQAAETTQTVDTIALPESTGTGVTPEPQVNAGTATITLPESTGLAQSPEPVLFTDLFASMPVSTGNAASPNPTFAAGEATINLPESTGTAVSPNPSLFQANLIRAPVSTGTAVSPDPVIKGGLEEIALPVSTGTAVSPEPTIQFAQNLNLVVSSGNAASPAPTFSTGATTISLPESTGTGFTPNPSVAVSVVPRDDSNTLSIRQSQSKTLSGDINK